MLTDLKIKAAKPAASPYTLFDGGGLFLYVTTAGARSWRLKYRIAGKPKRLTLGLYPDVTLAQARDERDAMRRALREGRDPKAERDARRFAAASGHSLEAVALDWYERNAEPWRAGYAKEILDSLKADVFPKFGHLHVDDITAPMVFALIDEIEKRSAVTVAKRVRSRLDRIFAHAIARGVGKSNPAAMIRKTLKKRKTRKQPAIIDLGQLRTMLRTIEGQFTYPVTKLAMRLLALTVVRPRELRFAMWSEFEHLGGVAPIWRLPPERMKTNQEHIVPLSQAALDVLRAARLISGSSPYVFPNRSRLDRPISRSLLSELLRDAGYKGRHVPHGFRSSFSSIMNKRHKGEADVMEACLAHDVPGVRGDYMRETFDERRREIMAEWGDLILAGAVDAETLLLGQRRRYRAGRPLSRRSTISSHGI